MTTIILTVSRPNYLEKVITCIELLECNPADTNFLCIVDGNNELFIKARNLVNGTKFGNRLAVKFNSKEAASRFNVPERRQRIADLHNYARTLIAHEDGYVFSVEDDTTFNSDALKKLTRVASQNRAFGMAEGVELGRWGIPYVGGWLADDIYNVDLLTSIDNINPVPEDQLPSNIDAGGLYCALIRTDLYKQHTFYADNGLGPDINFGIENRQLGFENFIVWTVPCTHHFQDLKEEKTLTPQDFSKPIKLKKQNAKKWTSHY